MINKRPLILFIILLIAPLTALIGQNYSYKFYKVGDSAKFAALMEISEKAYYYYADSNKVIFDEQKANISEAQYKKLLGSIERLAYLRYQASSNYASMQKALSSSRKDTITHIGFYGKSWKKIPFSILQFKNLESIEIIGTHIKKLPWLLNWSLFGLNELREIKILNQVNQKAFIFKKNQNIETLVYRENPLAPQPKKVWKLRQLKELDFVRNDFTKNNDFRLDKYDHLVEANFRNNQIIISNLTKKDAHSIQKLILSRNKITEVPQSIEKFVNLRELQLAENQITSEQISPKLAHLAHLQLLSFYKNKLTFIPTFIFDLDNLIELDLYHNGIEILPASIHKLKKLESLYLANNEIYSIPEEVGSLTNLKQLYLKFNRISYLPNSLCKLKNITDFHINNNYLQRFPMCILEYEKLVDLDISFNEIHTLPIELLQLDDLKLLWMRGITFEAGSKEEALAIKHTIESLQKRGVKVSIDLK